MSAWNLADKLDRAIVAYLIGEGVGTASNIWPAENANLKTLPCIVVATGDMKPEAEDYASGNRVCDVEIAVKSKGYPDMGDDDGDDAQKILDIKAANNTLLAACFDAMTKQGQTGDRLYEAINAAAAAEALADPTNNSDLAEFSIIGLQQTGESRTIDDDGIWVNSINLAILCCASDRQ